jgi:hydroxymethylpyrimidine pyrophosphatase-like HAD family hydrolase
MKHTYLNPELTLKRTIREYETHGSLIIAVDFDNTLYDYHKQGLDCSEVIALLHDLRRIRCKIIIWTASDQISFIESYCHQQGIPYDGINSNPPFFNSSSPKIYYNELLDDRAGLAEVYERLMALVRYVDGAGLSHENANTSFYQQ